MREPSVYSISITPPGLSSTSASTPLSSSEAAMCSSAAITSAYGEFSRSLSGHNALVCYSVKANSNLAVLALLAQLGAGFDIVSGGELARVLVAGGDAVKTLFSGVGKTEAEIELA